MQNNHIYNLMSQLVTEHRSLWRLKKFYLKDAKGCKKCREFWTKLIKDKESHVKEILNLLKEHKAL